VSGPLRSANAEQAKHDAEDCGRLVSPTREDLGWTRVRLAEAAGMAEAEVTLFEDGRTYPVEPVLLRPGTGGGWVATGTRR